MGTRQVPQGNPSTHFFASDSAFHGQKEYSSSSSGSLLSQHGSLSLLAILCAQNAADSNLISVMRRYAESDGPAVLHSQRDLPYMFLKSEP